MSININNYEEYFLLYADNELSAPERKMVEDFVNQNPKLEEELLMFKQSVIKPDGDCVMEDKGFLYKETQKFINHANYQEILIMYNDNELNGWEREETESFLLQNSEFRNELILLKKTKLIPDATVTFPGNQALYRKEGKGKVIPFKWWRNVAAAVITAIGLWTGISYLQNDSDKLPVAVQNKPVKKINEIAPIPVIEKSQKSVKSIAAENNKIKKVSSEKSIVKNSAGKSSKINHTPDVQLVKKQKKLTIVPQPGINIKNIENENQSVAINKVQELKDIKLINKKDSDIALSDKSKHNDIVINNKNTLPDNYALAASYTPDEVENSNNYVFYNITKEEFNRTKLGGFLRKVKRTIERKSPFNNSKEDNEVAVKEPFKKL